MLDELINGLKKPFQTPAEKEANKASAVASYGLVIGLIALLRSS